jgi:hypothetical protein
VARRDDGWQLGFPADPEDGIVKRPGISGPITDAYYDRMVHVYGTQVEERTDALRKAAERGARGWPLWLWFFEQEVVADRDVTDEMMRSAHLVLYGTEGDNEVLGRIRDRLPIRISDGAVVAGKTRYEGDDVGVRFIHPNPLAPDRYVIVQAGVTVEAVRDGHKLPDFLPDYLVYDGRTTRRKLRLVTGGQRPLDMGYFDSRWRLPGGDQESDGDPTDGSRPGEPRGSAQDTDDDGDAARTPRSGEAARANDDGAGPAVGAPDASSALAVPDAPPVPGPPERFAAPRTDPAGRIARRIARRVARFENHRAETPGGTWRTDEAARWSIRPTEACLSALESSGVPVRPRPPQPGLVPSPVELVGAVEGVWFRSTHTDRPLVVSCELAARLPHLAATLKRHGIRGVDVMSALRRRPKSSFHTMGLALDLARFWTPHGWLSVANEYEATPNQPTCQGPAPQSRGARTLRELACDLARSGRWSTVLTPSYNEGHRDHFHLDARPDDPRVFLR